MWHKLLNWIAEWREWRRIDRLSLDARRDINTPVVCSTCGATIHRGAGGQCCSWHPDRGWECGPCAARRMETQNAS